MDKKQTPHTLRVGTPKALLGKLPSARYWIAMALLALCLMSFKDTAFAQVACLNECQQTFIVCFQSAEGDPVSEARCQDKYNDCSDGCLMD